MPDRPLSRLPPTETERLRLRPLDRSDAEAFRAMTDEPAIIDAIHFLARPFTLTDAERLILGEGDGRDCFWGVWRREIAVLVGTVGTHLRGDWEIEIGYWFGTASHGLGFGTEAVARVLSTLADAYPGRRIVAECRVQNTASWRLLDRAGFAADGPEGKRSGRRRLVLMRPASDQHQPDHSTNRLPSDIR